MAIHLIVGGTMVKEGEYKIRFDEVTGALTVMDMDGDLVASAIGQVVQLDDDADVTAITTTETVAGRVLTAVQMHAEQDIFEPPNRLSNFHSLRACSLQRRRLCAAGGGREFPRFKTDA
jgi:hypothetical protein